MAVCKISICFLVVGVFWTSNVIATTYRPPVAVGPVVSIDKVTNMTPSMQLDASDMLKRAYVLTTSADRCTMFRQLFAEKYPQFTWHVALYQAFSVQSLKSIILKVTNNNRIELFLLFATKK